MAMRLDKYLSQAGLGTRSEVKKFIRSGRVLLDGVAAKKPEEKVEEGIEVLFDGSPVIWEKYEYFMLNKPAGVVSATQDNRDKTVLDLLTCVHSKETFPVGRLDKDTEGLLLLTNDGSLAHELLSPRKHVSKRYLVWVEGEITPIDIMLLEKGLDIGDEKLTLPAELSNISYYVKAGEKMRRREENEKRPVVQTRLEICISEGRYHQIKRMFAAVGKQVQYLKRLSMGCLELDEALALGEFRKLTEEEIKKLKKT